MFIATFAWFAAPASGQSTDSRSSGLPPLIDRELFFGNPEIVGAQLSPDGQFLAFIKPYKDTLNIWVKKSGEPFSAAHVLTADTKRPITQYFWSRDSKYILYVQDQGGDENYNVYAVSPTASPAEGQDVPAARNLTDAKGARALIYSAPRRQPDVLYIGLNDRDASWHDLYRLQISTGERTLMRENTERIAGWFFDLDGDLRLALRTADNGDTEILRVDDKAFTKVYSCSVFELCGPARFHKDGQRVYMETNKGGDVNLIRLVLFDPATGTETMVEADPEKRVDLGHAIFSEATDELVATVYIDDRERIYFHDEGFETDYELLQKKLPGKEITLGSRTRDERVWLVTASSDTEPGETYVFDRESKDLTLQYRIREKLPRESLASMKAISYKSSDGLTIPAYLTLPRGVPAKNLPLIVVPHGGPWARDTWGYDGLAQFLANRGYAVLQPNFRGSTGYGKEFMNAGNLQWGDLMQDDITWGVKHLVNEGIADPERVGIMGGSYGGYATLAGVTFTPDVYAAAVSIVGPSNLITLLDSIPPYWEAGRKMFHERMGDPGTPEGRQQLERQSPLNSAQKIETPLLVVQGANDPRVKQAESDQIVIALRDRGFPVEYLVAPDEGHGFARPVNSMAMFATAEKFLATHLDGRYQESMPENVAERLAAISVDPKTVTLTEAVDPSDVGTPEPAEPLRTEPVTYKATIDAGGQTLNMEMTRDVREENGTFVVTETAQTPMGPATDVTVLDKGTLVPQKRTVTQGPVTIDLTFAEGKASGTMSMQGQERAVNVDLGGPLFADGAGAHAVLATLPLKEGYEATFRNLNVQQQKVALKRVRVVGSEQVTVPAGTFDAWQVEVASAEGEPGTQTLWVDKESRKVVKVRATLPQMGGATLVSELQ